MKIIPTSFKILTHIQQWGRASHALILPAIAGIVLVALALTVFYYFTQPTSLKGRITSNKPPEPMTILKDELKRDPVKAMNLVCDNPNREFLIQDGDKYSPKALELIWTSFTINANFFIRTNGLLYPKPDIPPETWFTFGKLCRIQALKAENENNFLPLIQQRFEKRWIDAIQSLTEDSIKNNQISEKDLISLARAAWPTSPIPEKLLNTIEKATWNKKEKKWIQKQLQTSNRAEALKKINETVSADAVFAFVKGMESLYTLPA